MGSKNKMHGVAIWALALAMVGGMASGCARKTPAQRVEEARLKQEKLRVKEQQKQAEARAKEEKKRVAAQQKALAEQQKREAEQQKRDAEQQKRDAEQKRLAEARAEKERQAAEVRAGEERRAAEMKAVEQRKAEARAAEERRLAQARADQERAANEARASQQRQVAAGQQTQVMALQANEDRKATEARTREEKKQAEARMKEEKKLAEARAKDEKKAAEARKKEDEKAAELAKKRQQERDKQFMPDEEEMHTVDAFAQAQSAAGAKEDGMLFDSHFDGTQLNTAGQSKVNLMLQNRSNTKDTATVYLALPANDANASARQSSLEQYLQTTGLGTNVQIKSGENPAMRTAAARGLLNLKKTDSNTQGQGTSDNGGYTSAGMGAPSEGSAPATK